MKNVGRYKISGRLGRGGMSTVYKAHAPITGRSVALKILLPRDEIFVDLVGEKKLREIFLEEALIMGEINHDHVAKIIDCDTTEDGSPFIVLEYFTHSLGALIGEAYQVEKPSRIISINKSFQYIEQSLKGLERLHFAGIIHRDIKPYNLMITNDDRVKIIDFGLSRVRGEEKMAIPGMQVGSPYYAAPEQEQDPKKADERADLFSVGIMAYRMVTGSLPMQLINPNLPSSLNEDLNNDWDDFLLKSINPDPTKRYSSAQEMRMELQDIHALWLRKSKSNFTFLAQDQASPSLESKPLRTKPTFVRYKTLKQQYHLDPLMRPQTSSPHRFEIQDKLILRCIDTKRLWQRQGAGFPVTWDKAWEYIEYLNKRKWQGKNTWRLPTIDELNSLLKPQNLLRDFGYESYFSQDIHWIWSSDTCTKKKAWSIDVVESYFQQLDKDGMASVCAVCNLS